MESRNLIKFKVGEIKEMMDIIGERIKLVGVPKSYGKYGKVLGYDDRYSTNSKTAYKVLPEKNPTGCTAIILYDENIGIDTGSLIYEI